MTFAQPEPARLARARSGTRSLDPIRGGPPRLTVVALETPFDPSLNRPLLARAHVLERAQFRSHSRRPRSSPASRFDPKRLKARSRAGRQPRDASEASGASRANSTPHRCAARRSRSSPRIRTPARPFVSLSDRPLPVKRRRKTPPTQGRQTKRQLLRDVMSRGRRRRRQLLPEPKLEHPEFSEARCLLVGILTRLRR
jgi:hypothetical protein